MVSHEEIKKKLESKRKKDKELSHQNENIKSDNDQKMTSDTGNKGFLFCSECNGYYELQEGESIDDFESCECGNKLEYVDKIEDMKNKKSKTSEKS